MSIKSLGYTAIMAIAAAIALQPLYADRRPPISNMDNMQVMNSPITEGEVSFVRSFRTKLRNDCTVTSSRYAVNNRGKVYDLPDYVGPGGSANSTFVEMQFDTSNLPPGEYMLFSTANYLCPSYILFKPYDVFTYTTPAAKLVVEPK